MTTAEEIWASVPGYEGMYEASNQGRIMSIRRQVPSKTWRGKETLTTVNGGVLVPLKISKYGHLGVNLSKSGKPTLLRVHRLVLEAHSGPCPDGFECRHLDGNPENNSLDNLSWGTHQQNVDDMTAHGTKVVGQEARHSKLRDCDVLEIRELAGSLPQWAIAANYGVSQSTVSLIVTRKRWTHI